MNDLITIDIDRESKLLIFSVEKNVHMIESSIVPREQLKKIERFRDTQDRSKRLLARTVLFDYYKTNYGLEDFTFMYTDRERPRFKNIEIDFNISYSKDIVAIAISTMGRVGLDIEYLDDVIVSKNSALEFMNEREFSIFENLKKEQRTRYFYEVWTSKESFLKASGDGLYINPKTVTNSLAKTFYLENYVISVHTHST